MNGFGVSISCWTLLGAFLIFSLGCKQESARQSPQPNTDLVESPTAPQFRNELDGETILRNVVSRYATAKTYQDKAVLYLTYQLEGRNIQEPQRWSTTWDRSGKLSSQLFNGSIQADGKLLSCYVFDIDTANLDNQHLLMPYDQQLPLNRLFRDPIARHFLGGYSELPLDETDMVSAPKLIPPPISLLTNQVRNGWLQNPSQVERLPDQSIDEKPCYVVRCLSQGMTADVWIDVESNTLMQMSLPLKLLVGEVITSPEIADVVLMARFHEAKLDHEIAASEFALKPRGDATPVRKFVSLPESFPSDLIGQAAPKFSLIAKTGKPTRRLDFDGKITTLLWLAGRPSYSAIGKLDDLAASFPTNKYHFGSVYSDAELKSPGTGSIEVIDVLAKSIDVTNSSAYYDSQLTASTALRVQVVPSVIVMDGDSKIQFAQSLSNKNWLDNVKAAVERVAQGEDVAAEMQADYQRYLDSYRQQLLTVSAADLIDVPAKESGALVLNNSPPPSVQQGVGRVKPIKRWVNHEFKQAGNLRVLNAIGSDSVGSQQANILAFDGWRTIVAIDAQGVTQSRIELKLPEGAAVSQIRIGKDSTGESLFAVFGTLGKRVFLFDQMWNPVGMYPQVNSDDTTQSRIRDCQLSDLNSDGTSELIVSFEDERGIELVDPGTMKGERISTAVATSVVSHQGDVAITGSGKIEMLKTGLINAEDSELAFRRLTTTGDNQLCGLGVTDSGQWNAVGFDSELKRVWTLSIGSQFFETEIESTTVIQAPTGELIWAIADSENTIHLVSGSGKWLGDFQTDSQLQGIALTISGRDTVLVVSNEQGVEGWSLYSTSNPMRPVSTRK